MRPPSAPLSAAQRELLQMFARDVSDEDWVEIRRLVARYFADRASDGAGAVWEEKGWTDEDAERMLHGHDRRRA